MRRMRFVMILLGCCVGLLLVAGEAPPLRWEVGAGGQQPMVAVLSVVADEYQAEPHHWNLPAALASSQRFVAGLRDVGALDERGTLLLRGREVHQKAVERAIATLSELEPGRPLTLIVHWIGHGWTQDGRLHLMTYYTTQERSEGAGTARWQETIDTLRLHGWLTQARAARERAGGALEAVCVYQVCRPQLLLPSDPVPVLVADEVWQLFSVPAGHFAPAPRSDAPDAFTLAWETGVRRLAERGQGVRLAELHRELGALLRQRQEAPPELTPPRQAPVADGPLVVPTARIDIMVEVVDALTQGVAVRQAEVNLSGRRLSLPEGRTTVEGIMTGPQHRLVVSAPGYQTRSAELAISRRDLGRRLVVPLLPALWVVRGRISEGLAEVVARGGTLGTLRREVHRTRVATDALGAFELLLPLDAGPVELAVQRGGATVLTLALPSPLTGSSDGYGNRHSDLGIVQLPQQAGSDRLDRLAIAVGGGGPLRFLDPRLEAAVREPAPPLPRDKAELWASALKDAEAGQLEVAANRLQAVLEGCPPASRPAVERRLAWLRCQQYCEQPAERCFAAAEAHAVEGEASVSALLALAFARALDAAAHQIEVGFGDDAQVRAAIDAVQAVVEREQRLASRLPPATRQRISAERLRLASQALRRSVSEQRHEVVIRIALAFRGSAWDAGEWPTARDEAAARSARVLVQRARELAIASDDDRGWEAYDRLVQRLAPWGAAIRDELAESQAERLPAAARRAWQESRRALAAGPGGWAAAYAALERAEQAGLTDRYLRQADAERRRLGLELYLLAEAEAGSLEAEAYRLPPGREREAILGRAIDLLARARGWWPDACDRLAVWMRQLPQHPAVHQYRKQYEAADAAWRQLRRDLDAVRHDAALRRRLLDDLARLPSPERWFVRSELAALQVYDALRAQPSLKACVELVHAYPQHPQRAEVADLAWQLASEAGDAAAYDEFSRNFPEHRQAASARARAQQQWVQALERELAAALPPDPGPRPLRGELEHRRDERRSLMWAVDAEGGRTLLAEAAWSRRGAAFDPEPARAALQGAWARHRQDWEARATAARQALASFPSERLEALAALDRERAEALRQRLLQLQQRCAAGEPQP